MMLQWQMQAQRMRPSPIGWIRRRADCCDCVRGSAELLCSNALI